MSYKRMSWRDHVVENERTYSKTVNKDGTETFKPAFGRVLSKGTPQSATNFNHMEEGIEHVAIAYDLLYVLTQAKERVTENTAKDNAERVAVLEVNSAIDRVTENLRYVLQQAENRGLQNRIESAEAKLTAIK